MNNDINENKRNNTSRIKSTVSVTTEADVRAQLDKRRITGTRNLFSNFVFFMATAPLNIALLFFVAALTFYLLGNLQFFQINLSIGIIITSLYIYPVFTFLPLGSGCQIVALFLGHRELKLSNNHPRKKTIIASLVLAYMILFFGVVGAYNITQLKKTEEFSKMSEEIRERLSGHLSK